MDIKTLTPGLSVAAQIAVTDMQDIKDQGFKAIICNQVLTSRQSTRSRKLPQNTGSQCIICL